MRRTLIATVFAMPVVALVVIGAWICWPLSPALTRPDVAPAVVVADRDGLPLRGTRAGDGTRARWSPIGEIDPDLITAFVAVEDHRFFEHHGIDWLAVARAMRDDLRARRIVSGASTLTMQTARLLAGGERDWGGKLAQVLWALRLERHLSKQEILEQYLNRVHLGQGTVGVAAATAFYFDAPPNDISVGQAAMLAGLAHAPASSNPLRSTRRAAEVRNRAVARMRAAGFVGGDDARRAISEPLLRTGRSGQFLAPHFTTRVLDWAQDSGLVDVQSLGVDGVLRTSLDLPLQTLLEAEVRHTVDILRDRGVREAAAVVLDNRTGELLAWVGSPDFWADTSGQTDMVVSPRQPGSALKPFVYGLAFDRGYTPAFVIADVARSYQTSAGSYHPRNYDHRFHGPVRVREALGSSYNVPAVDMAERLGTASVLTTLHDAGFASLKRSADYYGLGIALGNGDVTLLELANAYRSLANGGVWRPVRWRPPARGERAGGEEGRRVMTARSAALVLDILSDADARVPAFGVSTPFDFAFPVAAKTGTSRHFTDNWAVGVTGRFTVAAWVGNFSGRPMEGVSGVSGAGPLLHRAVLAVASRHAPGVLLTPREAGAVPSHICRLSGLLATAACPEAVEWFAPGTEPREQCTWHRGERVVLPQLYAAWVEQARTLGAKALVTAGEGCCGTETASVTSLSGGAPRAARADSTGLRIISPLDGDHYSVPPSVDARYSTIALRASGASSTVRWTLDGRVVTTPRLRLVRGTHVVRAESGGESREVRFSVD